MLIEELKALSDLTRLRIINILRNYELTVNELVFVLDMGQSRVSRHLKILHDASLIGSRREGLYVHYFHESGTHADTVDLLSVKLDEIKNNEDMNRCEFVLMERREKGKLFFNEIASSWKDIKKEILGDYDGVAEILNYLGKYQCKTVADLGCGVGDLTEKIHENGYSVIGVDYSPAMIERAKSRFKKVQIDVDFRIGEIEHLPMRDNEVDCAILNLVLHHLSNPKRSIEEIARTIQKGKYFILVDFARHTREDLSLKYGDRWLGFEKSDIDIWLRDSGLKTLEYHMYSIKNSIKLHIYCAQKTLNGGKHGSRSVAKGA